MGSKIDKTVSITPRSLRFQQKSAGHPYWNDNCPVKTHFFNAIMLAAPALEKLAISSLVPFKDKIDDAKLNQQVKDFISQEAAHTREFIRLSRLLQKQGYVLKPCQKRQQKIFVKFINLFSPKTHLSFTLAIEHINAIFSEVFLREPHWLENAEPSLAALYRWHAIEEIEHKAVAFDVYQVIQGGYFRRMLGMILMSMTFGFSLIEYFFVLSYQDKLLTRWEFWHKTFSMVFGKRGLLRSLWHIYWGYYKRDFHPWDQNNLHLIQSWQTKLVESKTEDEMLAILASDYLKSES